MTIRIFVIIRGNSQTDLLALSLEVALLPGTFPFVNFGRVGALPLHFVIDELSLVMASVDIGHLPLTVLLSIAEAPFVSHAIVNFLPALAVRLRVTPLSLITENLLLIVFSVFDEGALSLKLPVFAGSLIKSAIGEYIDAVSSLGPLIDNWTKIEFVLEELEKDRRGGVRGN